MYFNHVRIIRYGAILGTMDPYHLSSNELLVVRQTSKWFHYRPEAALFSDTVYIIPFIIAGCPLIQSNSGYWSFTWWSTHEQAVSTVMPLIAFSSLTQSVILWVTHLWFRFISCARVPLTSHHRQSRESSWLWRELCDAHVYDQATLTADYHVPKIIVLGTAVIFRVL